MNKIKTGIIFGGMSTEHDVSVISGKSIIDHINKDKYEIFPMYIDKNGIWYICDEQFDSDNIENHIKPIDNIMEYLKSFDVVFPILHGKYGEDGTMQGLLELLKIPTVGCGVLASSVAMDKVYTKIVLDKANIKQAKSVYVRAMDDKYVYYDKEFNEISDSMSNICKYLEAELKYPMFIKPSNSGSSVGINKAKDTDELAKYIEEAAKYDDKILVEQGIDGREVECSVLGNSYVKASCVGEIKPADDFYTFDAKYNNSDSKLTIPANISKDLSDKIRAIAVKAFKAIDGKGFSRIDFFVENGTDEIYLNEINTLPGFTSISMYPKLWENDGLAYEKLIDELISLAMTKK